MLLLLACAAHTPPELLEAATEAPEETAAPPFDVGARPGWDLTQLYPDGEAWVASYEATRAALDEAAGRCGDTDGAEREACTALRWSLGQEVERLQLYADLRDALAAEDAVWQERSSMGWALHARRGALSDALAEDDGVSPEVRRVVTMAGELRLKPHEVYNAARAELNAEVPKPKDPSPEARVAYLQAKAAAMKARERSMGATLDAKVAWDTFDARARGYERSVDAVLTGDRVPPEVYEVLLQSAREGAPRAMWPLTALRRDLLGLEFVSLPYKGDPLTIEAPQSAWTIAEAIALVEAGAAPLGEDYLATLRAGFAPDAGWYNLYDPAEQDLGKFGGCIYGSHPFVALPYAGELRDVFVFAHEAGHAGHCARAMAAQPFERAHEDTFIAELNSNLAEELLARALIAQSPGPRIEANLRLERLRNLRTTLFYPAMGAELELEMHARVEEGGAITGAWLSEQWAALMVAYLGPDYRVVEGDEATWVNWGHLFGSRFYLYQYATTMVASVVLAERLSAGEPGAAEAYLALLDAGGSAPGYALLKDAGVDLMDPAVYAEAMDAIAAEIAATEALLRELGELEPPPQGG